MGRASNSTVSFGFGDDDSVPDQAAAPEWHAGRLGKRVAPLRKPTAHAGDFGKIREELDFEIQGLEAHANWWDEVGMSVMDEVTDLLTAFTVLRNFKGGHLFTCALRRGARDSRGEPRKCIRSCATTLDSLRHRGRRNHHRRPLPPRPHPAVRGGSPS